SKNVRKVTAEEFKANPGLGSALPIEFLKIILKPPSIRNDMRTWLQSALGEARYAAYGDWKPIDPDSPPRLIPADYFQHGEINWSKSLLKMGGMEIFAIRVFRHSWVAAIDPDRNELPGNQSSSKGGRPTSKIRVSEAMWALMKTNKNFAGLAI